MKMIDIHCHILPAVDDGSASLDESLAMVEIAVADGISHIVATPHIKGEVHSPQFLQQQVADFNAVLKKRGYPLQILTGADVSAMLPPGVLARYTINGGNYFLLEFPHSHMPRNASELVFQMLLAGLRPIITHPERNPSIIRDPELLFSLVDAGCLVQLTAGSLVGDFGADARDCASYLLRMKQVHFLASDAHSATHRLPVLSEGTKAAAAIIGEDAARSLVTTNPAAIIAGRDLNG
jgi:protein-tyrosine phosphatase